MNGKRVAISLCVALAVSAACAETNNPATDWFSRAGYGVFVHYLEKFQNNPDKLHSLGRKTSWDECVREFDTERFAEAMMEAGAGYVFFTMLQQTHHLIAPNAAFDRLTGHAPGEACATRDLVEDLWQSLNRRGIPLMLYWTGDGPSMCPQCVDAMGMTRPVTEAWLEKWASVIEEYSRRYGGKVKGWWVDGSYVKHGNLQYDDRKLGFMARAMKAGNPQAIVAFNDAESFVTMKPYSVHDDYLAGERNDFNARPGSRWLGGYQWHFLTFLGAKENGLPYGWGEPGVCLTPKELINSVYDITEKGGVVSIDVMLFRDGSVDRSQLETLRRLRPGLAAMRANPPKPITSGNLAFRTPARQVSLTNGRDLPLNGSGDYKPYYGVDGDPGTASLASMEWPWSFEVDLMEARSIRRVKALFRKDGYPTRVRVRVSEDGVTWKAVAEADGLAGEPWETSFPPVNARLIRLDALKPDGPDQPGGQMKVYEFEVFGE